MALDARTLLFINILLQLIQSGMVMALWLANRRDQGLRLVGGGDAAGGAAAAAFLPAGDGWREGGGGAAQFWQFGRMRPGKAFPVFDGLACLSRRHYGFSVADETTLAMRLGMTTHVSSLRMKIRRLMANDPKQPFLCMEDWLLDLANERGVRSVVRMGKGAMEKTIFPTKEDFSNADLVVAICQPHNRDRPQWLRAAAELISKNEVNLPELKRQAKLERVEMVLAELAKQALRAEPEHRMWMDVREAFEKARPLRDVLIHWTRLTTKQAAPNRSSGEIPHRPLAR